MGIRQYTLSSGVPSYSIGPSGTFSAPRPTLIESAQINVLGSNVWLPISIWSKPQYDAIRNKGAVADIPDGIYPEYSFPNVTFRVNPLVTTSGTQLQIGAWEQLTQFVTLFDTIAMPPAYEAWLEAALAIILAPFYDMPVPQSLLDRRTETTGDLNRYNAQSMGGAVSEAQRLGSPNVGQPIIPGPAPGAPGQ